MVNICNEYGDNLLDLNNWCIHVHKPLDVKTL